MAEGCYDGGSRILGDANAADVLIRSENAECGIHLWAKGGCYERDVCYRSFEDVDVCIFLEVRPLVEELVSGADVGIDMVAWIFEEKLEESTASFTSSTQNGLVGHREEKGRFPVLSRLTMMSFGGYCKSR